MATNWQRQAHDRRGTRKICSALYSMKYNDNVLRFGGCIRVQVCVRGARERRAERCRVRRCGCAASATHLGWRRHRRRSHAAPAGRRRIAGRAGHPAEVEGQGCRPHERYAGTGRGPAGRAAWRGLRRSRCWPLHPRPARYDRRQHDHQRGDVDLQQEQRRSGGKHSAWRHHEQYRGRSQRARCPGARLRPLAGAPLHGRRAHLSAV